MKCGMIKNHPADCLVDPRQCLGGKYQIPVILSSNGRLLLGEIEKQTEITTKERYKLTKFIISRESWFLKYTPGGTVWIDGFVSPANRHAKLQNCDGGVVTQVKAG